MFFRSCARLKDSIRDPPEELEFSLHVPSTSGIWMTGKDIGHRYGEVALLVLQRSNFALLSSSAYCQSGPSQLMAALTSPIERMFDFVRAGDTGAVAEGVRSGFDFRLTDAESWTGLHWAVEYGHSKLVLILLDAEPLLLHMRTKEGLTAMSIAAWRGDAKMAQLLLDQGGEVDAKSQWGETPLHHAVSFGHLAVCELLLNNGANPHLEDKMERSPYRIAMQKGSAKMKKLFSKYSQESA